MKEFYYLEAEFRLYDQQKSWRKSQRVDLIFNCTRNQAEKLAEILCHKFGQPIIWRLAGEHKSHIKGYRG